MARKLFISTTSDSTWVSATDLMSGMMIIFMFIAVAFMKNVSDAAVDWRDTKGRIYEALYEEFSDSLPSWNAEIDAPTLTVRFREPSVLFSEGSATVTPRFRTILADFFPRYVNVLTEFQSDIAEVRIEGHTSSEWGDNTPPKDAYLNNLVLSQDRTQSVIVWCLQYLRDENHYQWAKRILIASGMSSSRLVLLQDGLEDAHASRRVEFRVRTNAEELLESIAGEISHD